MAGGKKMRLNKVLREFNISLDRAVDYLSEKGYDIEARPTAKISNEVYQVLYDGFQTDKSKKVASKEVSEERKKEQEEIRQSRQKEQEEKQEAEEKKKEEAEAEKADNEGADADIEGAEKEGAEKEEQTEAKDVVKAEASLNGPKQVGKIDLDKDKKGKVKKKEPAEDKESAKEEEKPTAKADQGKTEKEKDSSDDKEPKEAAPKKTKASSEKPKTSSEKAEASSEPKASSEKPSEKPETKSEEPKTEATETSKEGESTSEEAEEKKNIETKYKKLDGPNFTGEKIDLSKFKKKKKPSKKRKRKRISKTGGSGGPQKEKGNFKNKRKGDGAKKRKKTKTVEPTEEEVQKQVRETLEKLEGKSKKGKGAKYRRNKRDQHRQRSEDEIAQQEVDSKILKVTEFVTVGEVATMMDISVTKVISACMTLGMMVTMNQRLDAETLNIVAEEFGYEVEFVTADIEESFEVEEEEDPEKMRKRAPVVTVMGHVDHGKTSLLDYIRKENVIAGESGGITQHIGAYSVETEEGNKISFLDTPGHEAFTAMRARGAQVTDIAVIVIAADDAIMPQTEEAISHAQAAGVPIVFAINKIDLPNANVDKVKEELANKNLLVEDWGGKIQSQDISAKKGTGIDELLEKINFESEILELQANPDKKATGAVVEAYLDRGRGYVSTILVQGGTLKTGDYVLAGTTSGKIKAMHDERGNEIEAAGPATPVSILGLDGAPQAGDNFRVMDDEREAKEIASKRDQLQREQDVRTQRHVTLDEIGRRIALGDFKELNIILKGDVDGSVEALTDSFTKLSTEEIQVNIIHKGVGAITESDVLLASASDAIIIGFNVRPAGNASKVADREEIDIRTYSIIYTAINDLKDAMEGMLSPDIKEEITGNAEIRDTFKISKIGTIAGCMVTDGKIYRSSGVRLIRDGVVIYTGELSSLKRFKDDVKEVAKGYDCGMQIKNYNDIKEGDVIEAYQEVEVKKTLK
jgi:translation initiation factor IF-2